jgi:hypothetical protein
VNTLSGGAGNDWYYISRSDGSNVISDVPGEGRVNNIVLFGQFGTVTQWIGGTGVHDTQDGAGPLTPGYVLGSNGSGFGVNLGINGTTATLSYAANGGSVSFDTGQIQTITLWNPDLTYDNHTQEIFAWNGSTYVFHQYI